MKVQKRKRYAWAPVLGKVSQTMCGLSWVLNDRREQWVHLLKEGQRSGGKWGIAEKRAVERQSKSKIEIRKARR